MDYLTWTFYFVRLLANPSYYGLEDASTEGVQVRTHWSMCRCALATSSFGDAAGAHTMLFILLFSRSFVRKIPQWLPSRCFFFL